MTQWEKNHIQRLLRLDPPKNALSCAACALSLSNSPLRRVFSLFICWRHFHLVSSFNFDMCLSLTKKKSGTNLDARARCVCVFIVHLLFDVYLERQRTTKIKKRRNRIHWNSVSIIKWIQFKQIIRFSLCTVCFRLVCFAFIWYSMLLLLWFFFVCALFASVRTSIFYLCASHRFIVILFN